MSKVRRTDGRRAARGERRTASGRARCMRRSVGAAQQGNTDAQNKLGLLYLQGQGVPVDFAQAAAWISTAAEQGEGNAQANLGALYLAGRGVPRDLVQAYKWYQLSQQNGQTDWSGELQQMTREMSASEIADAKRMAVEWRPAHKGNPLEKDGFVIDLLE